MKARILVLVLVVIAAFAGNALATPIIGTITAERIGYATREGTIAVRAGEAIDVTIELTMKAIELDPIEVVVRSRRLGEAGFFDRRDNSGLSGRFITRLDLERRSTAQLTDALAEVQGVKVFYLEPGRTTVRFNRHVTPTVQPGRRQQYAMDPPRNALDARGCEPDLYIDGRLYRNATSAIVTGAGGVRFAEPLNNVDDFNAVPVSAIEGVEVYVGAAVPAFVRATACGVILIWTRH